MEWWSQRSIKSTFLVRRMSSSTARSSVLLPLPMPPARMNFRLLIPKRSFLTTSSAMELYGRRATRWLASAGAEGSKSSTTLVHIALSAALSTLFSLTGGR